MKRFETEVWCFGEFQGRNTSEARSIEDLRETISIKYDSVLEHVEVLLITREVKTRTTEHATGSNI